MIVAMQQECHLAADCAQISSGHSTAVPGATGRMPNLRFVSSGGIGTTSNAVPRIRIASLAMEIVIGLQ
jgi:hypothetical protein